MFRSVHLLRVGRPGGEGLPPLESLDVCAAGLARLLGVSIRVRMEIVDAAASYDPVRRQYSSSLLLTRLAELPCPEGARLLGITGCDLFVPILTFVFGEAQLNGRAAIVSTHRLEESFYGMPANRVLEAERLLKEAVHELGHTAGLRHCDDWNCAMSSSHAVERLDVRGTGYCEQCWSGIRS